MGSAAGTLDAQYWIQFTLAPVGIRLHPDQQRLQGQRRSRVVRDHLRQQVTCDGLAVWPPRTRDELHRALKTRRGARITGVASDELFVRGNGFVITAKLLEDIRRHIRRPDRRGSAREFSQDLPKVR